MPKLKDITGQVFGRLTAVSFCEIRNRKAYWNCVCRCGSKCVVIGKNLRNGATQSCGCLHRDLLRSQKTTHGWTSRAEFRVWLGMIERCTNSECASWEGYGGRGVVVCDRWRNSMEHFVSDVGQRPSPKHSIDRINNNGNYSCGHCEQCLANGWPMNCRWATAKQQSRNMRTNHLVTIESETHCIAEWCDIKGISAGTVYSRVKYGWSIEKAIATPVRAHKTYAR